MKELAREHFYICREFSPLLCVQMIYDYFDRRFLCRSAHEDFRARYVFGLGEWAIESAKGQACVIATFKHRTGFEVCLGIPFEACRGWYLPRAAETHDLEEQQPADLELLRTCHA